MSKYADPVFDRSKPLEATKHFIAGGRKFAPGDPFDWRKMLVTPRRVQQMIEQRKVAHVEDGEIEDAELTFDEDADDSVDQDTTEDDVDGDDLDTETDADEDEEGDEITEEYVLSLTSLKELQDLAEELGVDRKRSKAKQAEAILDYLATQ